MEPPEIPNTPDPKPAPAPEAPPAAPPPAPPPPTASPEPPPVAKIVLDGKETEQTANLRKQLEEAQSRLKERETKIAEMEDKARREAPPVAATRQKKAWLSGNALFD